MAEAGIGVDIVEISRMKSILEKTPSFARRVFTEEECAYCDASSRPAAHYASRFASREAVLKALGTGFSQGVGRKDVSVTRDKLGKPKALLSGRAYAVTGDRIECDFTVNGQGLGETVRGAKRKLRCAVKGEYWADKLVIYKNCRPLAGLCGAQLRPKPARAYKLRVEMGWGNSEELMRWAGRITTDGRLAGANLYLRGRSLLSPTNHDGSPVEVNEIDNRVLEQDTQAFAWQCETVRNKSTLHPQTDAVVAEIEGGPDTVVNVTVNGRTHTASIAQLLDGGVTWHVKPWHSEAVKIHAAVPDSAYEMVLEAEDEGSGGMDVYHAEFAQKNGQWAFVSPIYAGL